MKRPAVWYREWKSIYLKKEDKMKTLTKQEESGIIVAVCIGLAALMLLIAAVAQADDCQDPEKLTPELKKAYYELKELEEEIQGMTVAIRCKKIEGYGKIVQDSLTEGEANVKKGTGSEETR